MFLPDIARILISILGFFLVITFTDGRGMKRYQLEIENLELFRRPQDLFQVDFARIAKLNDTTFVFNMAGNLTTQYPSGTKYTPTMYEKLSSNKYSMIPVKLASVDIEEFFKKDVFFMPGLLSCSNLPRDWPVKAGHITVKNYIPDMTHAPLELPGERWRVEHVVSLKNKELFRLHAYIYINRNI